VKIDAALLHQTIYNTLIFTPGKGEAKKTTTRGDVLLSARSDGMFFIATEGYVVLSEKFPAVNIDIPPGDSVECWIRGDELREFEKALREIKGEISLSLPPFDLSIDDGPTLKLLLSSDAKDYWDGVRKLLAGKGVDGDALDGPFAIGPDRLSKFSRLKPQGEYPLDLKRFVTESSQDLLYWKYGPAVRGILVPLNRDIIREHYAETPEVLWKG